MTIEEEFQLLSRIELFEHLDPVQLKRLIFVSQRYQLEPEEYLFRYGDTSETVFGIVEGEFSVLLDSAHGAIDVAQQGCGELVGEMAVISGQPRNASVRANTASEVIAFEKDLFISTVTSDPQTALKLMQLLSERIVTLNNQLMQLSGDQLHS